MRVLFLNWRDLSNPAAGGAERFTEEVGQRLVSYGNEVTIFTSSFDGSEPESERLGMRIIRQGGKYTVYFKAHDYVKQHHSEFDIIVDEINTVPFRINKVVKSTPVVALIHQLAREIWFYETRFPINILGYYALEPLWLRGYRKIPTITVSDSTKNQLVARGFESVHVIHNGINVRPLSSLPAKENHPVLIYLGRFVRSKFPAHAIEAFGRVKRSLPKAELWMVGDGYLRSKLESNAPEGVKFFGRVSDAEKSVLLQRAHLLVIPSVREGWGISVVEANAMGTPAVGYDVPGLRDSIVNQKTGVLAEALNVQALADSILSLLENPELLQTLSKNALEWSANFSWDTAAKEFHNILDKEV